MAIVAFGGWPGRYWPARRAVLASMQELEHRALCRCSSVCAETDEISPAPRDSSTVPGGWRDCQLLWSTRWAVGSSVGPANCARPGGPLLSEPFPGLFGLEEWVFGGLLLLNVVLLAAIVVQREQWVLKSGSVGGSASGWRP